MTEPLPEYNIVTDCREYTPAQVVKVFGFYKGNYVILPQNPERWDDVILKQLELERV